MPSLLEYLSYNCNFMGILAGPTCSYNDYIAFIEGRAYQPRHQENANGKENRKFRLSEPSPKVQMASGDLSDVMRHNQTASFYLFLLLYFFPPHLGPECCHLQAVHLCSLSGHLSVPVQAVPCGLLHKWWVCQICAVLCAGHLPLPVYAGSEAKVLLCLDSWWVWHDFFFSCRVHHFIWWLKKCLFK